MPSATSVTVVVLAFILLRDYEVSKGIERGGHDGKVIRIIVGVLPADCVRVFRIKIPMDKGTDEKGTNGNGIVVRGGSSAGDNLLDALDVPVFVEKEHAQVAGIGFALEFLHNLDNALRNGTERTLELHGISTQHSRDAAEVIVSARGHTGIAARVSGSIDIGGHYDFSGIGRGQKGLPRCKRSNGRACSKVVLTG